MRNNEVFLCIWQFVSVYAYNTTYESKMNFPCFPPKNLGQKVSNLDELELNVTQKGRVIKTDKNEQFTVDLVICCAGNRINSDAYRSSLGKLTLLCGYR